MILRKIIDFFDFIIVWVSKPVDFIASLCTRELKSPLEVILFFFGMILGLPVCVVLGLLCTVLSLIRLFLGGDFDESTENNQDV